MCDNVPVNRILLDFGTSQFHSPGMRVSFNCTYPLCLLMTYIIVVEVNMEIRTFKIQRVHRPRSIYHHRYTYVYG
jgi:hypothetical protein